MVIDTETANKFAKLEVRLDALENKINQLVTNSNAHNEAIKEIVEAFGGSVKINKPIG